MQQAIFFETSGSCTRSCPFQRHAFCQPKLRRRHLLVQAESGGGSKRWHRREILLHSAVAPPVALLTIAADPVTILNSVLSGYGLPTMQAPEGFVPYDEFDDEFTFEYPRAWVVRSNRQRKGVYASNFQTADKASVEVFPLPVDGDVARAAIDRAVAPGGSQQDDRLTMPSSSSVKQRTETHDGLEYLYLTFPSETVTRSGYQIKRKNYVVATTKKGVVYTLAASARSDQHNEAKKQMLIYIVESFRVR